jgi:arylsulfatase A-like enzyme
MKFSISRREFLKLISLSPIFTLGLSGSDRSSVYQIGGSDSPNVLILVFDALSALHVSLYGYTRETMPNLARFAEKATVYHSHYSAGSFTTPGTASLLTGTYPWTHRALNLKGIVKKQLAANNIFKLFGNKGYHRLGFSHNLFVNILLHQLKDDLDEFPLPDEVAIMENWFSDDLFFGDYRIAILSEETFYRPVGELPTGLFSKLFFQFLETAPKRELRAKYKDIYPLGLIGHHGLVYKFEDTIDWVIQNIRDIPQPFLAYYHFWPPHNPYRPRYDFIDIFKDGWEPIDKPDHFFSDKITQKGLNNKRQLYDEYIAYADSEFGRLLDFFELEGIMENSWVIFTSDHGEMFERGIWKHFTEVSFDPLIRVPLLISQPGQENRQDIHNPTSCVDILPTLLHITGQEIPEWCEGDILPPYQNNEDMRSVFFLDSKQSQKNKPINKGTMSLIKQQYKLSYYFGYSGFDQEFELYDIVNDPQEMNNIFKTNKPIASLMRDEIKAKLEEVNKPYQK